MHYFTKLYEQTHKNSWSNALFVGSIPAKIPIMKLSRLTDPTSYKHPDSGLIEPGLLPVFRMIVGVQLLITLIGVGVASYFDRFSAFLLFEVAGLLLILFYLWWPKIEQRLGRLFLPIGLLIYVDQAIFDRLIFVRQLTQSSGQPLSEHLLDGSSWRLFVFLLIPLVLVAWQYNFRLLSLYVLLVMAISIGSGFLLLEWGAELWSDLIMVSVASAIFSIAIGYILTRLMNAQRMQRDALAEANARLTDYAAKVEKLSISHERNRLARELHDTLAHTLSAVSVQLEAVDSAWDPAPEKAREILHKSQAQTRSGLTETRRALQALRASPLDDLGLALAIQNLAESTATRAQITLELAVPDVVDQLSPQNEQGIYRIAQEALANIAKHAAADSFSVELVERQDDVTLKISDNGSGFDASMIAHNGHYGLRGMSERAEMMGAEFELKSTPKQGTTVQLVVKKDGRTN